MFKTDAHGGRGPDDRLLRSICHIYDNADDQQVFRVVYPSQLYNSLYPFESEVPTSHNDVRIMRHLISYDQY